MSGNLRKITSEQAREMGKRSGEVRRNKKKLRELLPYMLDLPEKNNEIKELLKKMGVDSALMTNQSAIIGRMIMQAKKGDVRAATMLFNLILNLDGGGTATETPTFRLEFVKNEDKTEATEATDNES